ncbi:unnamed protein product [Umbelopsis ramanniana]
MLMKLKALKVRPKKLLEASPCIGEMGAMLECWSRAGVDDPQCAQTAKALATCMSKPVKKSKATNTINYHLADWESNFRSAIVFRQPYINFAWSCHYTSHFSAP